MKTLKTIVIGLVLAVATGLLTSLITRTLLELNIEMAAMYEGEAMGMITTLYTLRKEIFRP